MPDQSITLPFTGPDLFAGFAGVKGLAKASSSELVLEFILKDRVAGREWFSSAARIAGRDVNRAHAVAGNTAAANWNRATRRFI